MTDEPAMWAAVDAAPDDPLPLMLMADWYDDHGEPWPAEALRFAVEFKKRPGHHQNGNFYWRGPYSAWGGHGNHFVVGPMLQHFDGPAEYTRISLAWTAWCLAWHGCRHAGYDPTTSYRLMKAVGPRNKWASHWRYMSLLIIAERIGWATDWDGMTADEKQKHLRPVYPFGSRSGGLYKVWLKAVRETVGETSRQRKLRERINSGGLFPS